MTILQWALLVVGAAVVIAVYLMSRRGARVPKDWRAPANTVVRAPTIEQSDMFSPGKYDEFGVGKPRKRTAPLLDAPSAPIEEPTTAPTRPAPTYSPAPATAPAPVAAAESAPKVEEKIFALLIAEREGTSILGPKLHAALKTHGLQYGARQIYHRMRGNMVVFSVASLLKPGVLDPIEAATFSTPGLSAFLVLPGPVQPVQAYEEMVRTVRALAASLNAEVFDSRRQLFTAEHEQSQKNEIEDWARANRLA